MPIIETSPYTHNFLTYNAPVNEKTKKIREIFKIDEETGYPEQYKWRGLAKLGTSYKPSDPYKKFKPYQDQDYYSTKITYFGLTGIISGGIHYINCWRQNHPIYSRPYIFLGAWALGCIASNFYIEKSLERQGIKQAIYTHYTEKYPERFGEIKRYKVRECLFHFIPCR